jgi:hypothetical protein
MNIDPDNEAIDILNNIANSLTTIANELQKLNTKGISASVHSNPHAYPVKIQNAYPEETNR